MAKGPLDTVLQYISVVVRAPRAGAPTDGELLHRFVARREEEAFATLVERHGPMVYGVCQRILHDPHDAADAFQATFLVLLRKAASMARQESLAGWLYGVAWRSAKEARLRAARRRRHEQGAGAMPHTDPPTEVAWREVCQVLDDELGRLPEKYRAPLVLHYLEGKTKEEAAEQLGWTEGTVSGRLARARELLRGRLTRRGVALSAGLLATVLSEKALVASVPAALVRATLQGALQFSAGALAAGAFSAPVAQLAHAVLHKMFLTRLAFAAALLLAVSAAGLGAGLLTRPQGEAHAVVVTRPLDSAAVPRPPQRLAHEGEVTALAFAPDGKTLLSASAKHTIRLWDVATGSELHRGERPQHKVFAFAFGLGGQPVASGSRQSVSPGGVETHSVRLWDSATGAEVGAFATTRPLGEFTGTFSPEGRTLAAAGFGQVIHFWDVTARKHVRTVAGHAGGVSAVAFSVDGTRFAWAGADHQIRLCEVSNSRKPLVCQGHQAKVTALVFLLDGKTVASGSADNTIRLWRVETGQEVRQLHGNDGGVTCLALSATGETLVSGSTDGTLRIWEVATGKELRRIEAHADGVSAVALSRDGKTVASGGKDRQVRLWELASAP